MMIPERVRQRILHWADRDERTGCLVSRYSVGSHGYAQVGWTEGGIRTVTIAHRALWIAERGLIDSCKHGHDKSWWMPKGPSRSKGYCHACRLIRQARTRGHRLRADVNSPRPKKED